MYNITTTYDNMIYKVYFSIQNFKLASEKLQYFNFQEYS